MAKDLFHNAVRQALEKDGWVITEDPLVVPAGMRNVHIDLGAERLFAAERGIEKIAVEVKSFLGDSPVTDFHKSLGQYQYYHFALTELQSDRTLYLAMPNDAYEDLFADPFMDKMAEHFDLHFIIFEPVSEKIMQWIK